EDYWVATKKALRAYETRAQRFDKSKDSQDAPSAEAQAILDTLEMHWARHSDAAGHALKTVLAFKNYLGPILADFKRMECGIGQSTRWGAVGGFLDISGGATRYLAALRKRLSNDLDAGVRWAEVVMNRHLAYAASGATAQFDPNELAHAVRVMCR